MELLLGNTEGTMEPMNVYTKQQRIAELARLMPDVRKHLREFLRKRVRDGVRIVHSFV